MSDRDPKFLIVRNYDYTDGINDPDMVLIDTHGNPILRENEVKLNKFEGSVEILRHPEYFLLVSSEKYKWTIYTTTERIICKRSLKQFSGLYEFMDHIDLNGNLIVVDPVHHLNESQMFKIVGDNDYEMNNYSICFQIAYTRISSVSIPKMDNGSGIPIAGGIEFWYKDSVPLMKSEKPPDSQIIVYPDNLEIEKPYDQGLKIHKLILKEKLKCVEAKKERDTNFGKGDYNTWKSTLTRALQKPDMLMRGSAEPNDEGSWDPILFQNQPIQWLIDTFERSLKASDKVNSTMN